MIAVIVLSYNDADYALQCVQSIRQRTHEDYGLVIVNNGCDERNTTILKNLNPEHYIRMNSNTGLPHGYNTGINYARGFADYVCLLNADTEVRTDGWLANMHSIFERGKVGMVAAMTNKIANRQQNWKHYGGQLPNKVIQARWVGLGMTMIPTAVVKDVGLLDESMSPGASVDVEYSFRLRTHGYSLYVDGHTYVWHEGKVAFNQLDVKYKTLLKRNNQYVKTKYPTLWQESFHR